MARYIGKRILLLIPVIIAVSILIFTIMYFVPGDVASIILGPNASAEELAAKNAELGLDKPYLEQLGRYLYNTFIRFDLGESYVYHTSVFKELMVRFPRTLVLSFWSILFSMLIGVPMGVAAAVRRGKVGDYATMFIALLGVSVPGFWVALMLVILFAVKLQWLPSYGIATPLGWVLPIAANALHGVAMQARQARSSMLEVISSDYITMARAKGLSNRVVIYKHALPNALIPVITMSGMTFGSSLGGALIIENVFSIPGVGSYLVSAVFNRDYHVVEGSILILAIAFSVIMLLTDLLMAAVDPKIKAQFVASATRKKKHRKHRHLECEDTANGSKMEDMADEKEPYLDLEKYYARFGVKSKVQEERIDTGSRMEDESVDSVTDELQQEAFSTKKHRTQFMEVLRRLSHNKSAMVGLVVLVVVILLSVFAKYIAPYTYDAMDPTNAFQGPSLLHWFGTDKLGRDVFSRCLYGGAYSLRIGLLAVFLSACGGIVLGAIAGFMGGVVDNVIMRICDVIQSLPGMVMNIALACVLGEGMNMVILAIGISGITNYARMMRASILKIRKMEYLDAARTINCGGVRIIAKHTVPNAISPLIVQATMGVSGAIMAACGLSYIGLGVQPPLPEWGAMINAGKDYIQSAPHMVVFPGLCIMITVLALNMLGDGLRDALDPKLKN